MLNPTIRRLELVDMDAAAAVHRASFEDRLPWLSGLHTSEEDRWYFRERVFQKCEIWGALDGATLVGILAFRDGWVDHLNVLPGAQGRGIGTALLQVAQAAFSRLYVPAKRGGSQLLRGQGLRSH